jgi:hypothetical protein
VHLRGGTDYALVNSIITTPGYCLDVDDASTVQAANPAIDEVGPPIIRSVGFSCTLGRDDPDADTFEADTFGAAGNTGNNTSLTPTLSNVFVNGANETAIAPFAAATLNAFFVNTTYVGAVRDANDIWYRGWTCDSSYANFGSNQNCNVVPN